ncbi:hypothetical protein [Streptacidiphilus sp. PAMC 29251]
MTGPSAHISAAALHLLLATHPEVDELPFGWRIELDATIYPFITVAHDRGEESLRLLAAALELEVEAHDYDSAQHGPMQSLRAEGRWGGADWFCIAYVKAALHVAEPPAGAVPVPAAEAGVWQ